LVQRATGLPTQSGTLYYKNIRGYQDKTFDKVLQL